MGSLAGQLAERGVNHLIEDKDVRSDLGSLADLAENPARELVKTAGVTALDSALGALGGKMDAGADKVIMATANKRMTRAVAKGSTTAVKKVVKSSLKIAGKKATDVLAEEAGNLADKNANNVLIALKEISQLPVEVARQQTEKVPTLKFLASQVPRRRIMTEKDEEEEEVENLCGAFVEISFQNLEDIPLAASPHLKCLPSQIPRAKKPLDEVENDEVSEEQQSQNLKFLASQVPQIPHGIAKDLEETVASPEDLSEVIECLGSQIPDTKYKCLVKSHMKKRL